MSSDVSAVPHSRALTMRYQCAGNEIRSSQTTTGSKLTNRLRKMNCAMAMIGSIQRNHSTKTSCSLDNDDRLELDIVLELDERIELPLDMELDESELIEDELLDDELDEQAGVNPLLNAKNVGDAPSTNHTTKLTPLPSGGVTEVLSTVDESNVTSFQMLVPSL
jgi:hypothetical protein